jgi:hypothetical protein
MRFVPVKSEDQQATLIARPLHGLAARLGGGGVVLVALDVRLDVLRRHQAGVVAEPDQLAGPVMRAAGLEADPAARQVGEEDQHIAARQPLAQHHPVARIDAMHLEHVPPGQAAPARGHAWRCPGRSW